MTSVYLDQYINIILDGIPVLAPKQDCICIFFTYCFGLILGDTSVTSHKSDDEQDENIGQYLYKTSFLGFWDEDLDPLTRTST